MTAGAELDITAGLSVSLAGLAETMRAQEQRRRERAAAISWISLPAAQFTLNGSSLPWAFPQMGPRTGYFWAVQRVAVAGMLVAATYQASDTVSLYKGFSIADAQQQNLLNVISAQAPAWHPGGRGLILREREHIIVGTNQPGGSNSGNTVTINVDAIQILNRYLPEFLI